MPPTGRFRIWIIVSVLVVSVATAPPSPAQTRDLTVATLQHTHPTEEARSRAARNGDMALSALLLLIIAAIWTIFSG